MAAAAEAPAPCPPATPAPAVACRFPMPLLPFRLLLPPAGATSWGPLPLWTGRGRRAVQGGCVQLQRAEARHVGLGGDLRDRKSGDIVSTSGQRAGVWNRGHVLGRRPPQALIRAGDGRTSAKAPMWTQMSQASVASQPPAALPLRAHDGPKTLTCWPAPGCSCAVTPAAICSPQTPDTVLPRPPPPSPTHMAPSSSHLLPPHAPNLSTDLTLSHLLRAPRRTSLTGPPAAQPKHQPLLGLPTSWQGTSQVRARPTSPTALPCPAPSPLFSRSSRLPQPPCPYTFPLLLTVSRGSSCRRLYSETKNGGMSYGVTSFSALPPLRPPPALPSSSSSSLSCAIAAAAAVPLPRPPRPRRRRHCRRHLHRRQVRRRHADRAGNFHTRDTCALLHDDHVQPGFRSQVVNGVPRLLVLAVLRVVAAAAAGAATTSYRPTTTGTSPPPPPPPPSPGHSPPRRGLYRTGAQPWAQT